MAKSIAKTSHLFHFNSTKKKEAEKKLKQKGLKRVAKFLPGCVDGTLVCVDG
jgi:hypothetical protein